MSECAEGARQVRSNVQTPQVAFIHCGHGAANPLDLRLPSLFLRFNVAFFGLAELVSAVETSLGLLFQKLVANTCAAWKGGSAM